MVTSLKEALQIAGTEAEAFGSADSSLLKRLIETADVPHGKSLALPAEIQGNFPVRPVEVLHALSLVTSPLYADDIHDLYMRWGLLRYLGFFKNTLSNDGKDTILGVSDAGCRVAGAQRRVTSEELGVGFGAVLARRWFRKDLGPGVPIGFIDIDDYARGYGGSSVRPDYLLIAPDTARPGWYWVRVLECKGTESGAVARRQMTKAIGQLGSSVLRFDPLPDGIAMSSVTYGPQVCCLAVEARGDSEVSYPPNWKAEDTRWTAEGFLAANLRKTWNRLAEFGGNEEASRIWSRSRVAPALGGRSRVEERHELETPFGQAVGVTETVSIGNLQLNVTCAIEKSVDNALSSGEPGYVTEAQSEFAERISGLDEDQPYAAETQAFSVTSDGSIYLLAQ